MKPPRVRIRSYDAVIEAGKPWTAVIEDPENDTAIVVEKTASDSLHVQITNPMGSDRSGLERRLEVRGVERPPEPPPPSSPEQICRQIWREELERDIDPDGLADCVHQLALGRSPESIRNGVRQSPEYAELQRRKQERTGRVAGRVRIDGRVFVNDRGLFRPMFASALAILVRSDDEVRAYLDWAAATEFNGLRIFAGDLSWAGQSAEAARVRLPQILTWAAERGLYVEITAITDSGTGRYDPAAHVAEIGRVAADYVNTMVEVANEPSHPTQSSSVHNFDNLLRWSRAIPEPVAVALGAPQTDEPEPDLPVGDYLTIHLDRGRDKWNQVRRVRELEAASERFRTAVLNNEPIGADERPRPGARENDPAFFFCLGALNRIFEVGGVFHSEHGLHALLPGPVQQACAEAFVEGSRVVPIEDRLTFKNARWPDSPIKEASFEQTVVRAYSGLAGNRAWTVLVGLSGDPRLELQGGWRVVGVVAERPGVQVLELQR